MPIAKVKKSEFHGLAATLRLARSTTLKDAATRDRSEERSGNKAARREALADFCRSFDVRRTTDRPAPNDAKTPSLGVNVKLSRRLRQTLHRLLTGDSEKQIAAHLQVSQHTVHVYVKSLYKQFSVNSRGELLARFVQMPATDAE